MKFLQDIIKKYEDPLYRNSNYLMINNILASFLGFIFWIIMAKSFNSYDVGVATALISVSGILSVYATLGLDVSIIRFLSKQMNKKSFINSCLTLVTLSSIGISIIFLMGINIWAPTLSYVNTSLIYIILFLVLTTTTGLFMIMTNCFIALRDTKDLLIQNLFLNLIRIPLPFFLIFLLGNFSIFAAFSLSMLLTLIISLIIFLRRKIPDYVPNIEFNREIISEVFHFSTVNYLATVFGYLPTLLMPLIIIYFLQPSENAYYYMAFTVASVLFIIPGAFSSSLLAEGAHDERNFFNNLKKTLKQTFIILIPAVIFTIIFGDKILLLFGEAYSTQGTLLLSLYAISAIFMAVNTLYLTYLRISMKNREIMILIPLSSILIIIISYVLIPVMGIVGAGVGYLIVQVILTSYIIFISLKRSSKKSLNLFNRPNNI